jgi:hypothetical protein
MHTSLRKLFFMAWILGSLLFEGFSQAATRVECGQTGSFNFEELSATDLKSDLDLWVIYSESFPESERVDPSSMIRYHEKEEQRDVFLRLTEDLKTIGFAHFTLFKKLPVSFLSYIAIEESKRGGGHGKKLLSCVMSETKRRFEIQGVQTKGVVLEVEKPERALDENDQVRRESTLRFYFRNQAEILLNDYFQPSLREGDPQIDMFLVFLPSSLPSTLSELGEEFKSQVRIDLYKEFYPSFWKSEGIKRFGFLRVEKK